jgi:hypothetical protein
LTRVRSSLLCGVSELVEIDLGQRRVERGLPKVRLEHINSAVALAA